MEALNIQSHLKTSNLYVRVTILRNNISVLGNAIYFSDKQKRSWSEKRDLQKQLEAQVVILNKTKKEIKKKEQYSLSFLHLGHQKP